MLCLPEGYKPRANGEPFLDIPGDLVYQPDVYKLAIFLARRMGAKRVIDIGCGSCEKWGEIIDEIPLVAIDGRDALKRVRDRFPGAQVVEWDLNQGLPPLPADWWEGAVVVCADVIEHLSCPERLASDLAGVCQRAPFVLVSTPDRERVRGWLDVGPPGNPAHVVEWSAGEFVRFLVQQGFPSSMLFGHTVNTNLHRAKTTLLVIAGKHATPTDRKEGIRVAAVIHAYNEGDILPEVVRHLSREGIEIHLFDNWSDEESWTVAQRLQREGLLSTLSRFPEQPLSEYEWARLLKKTEDFSAGLDADWVMHHDADELRFSPWRGMNLVEAIAAVDAMGYNAIDFTVLDFRFLRGKENPSVPFGSSLTHYEFGRRPGHFHQIKAWKKKSAVQLVESGGHEAVFEGRKVYPIKFLMKHYPLRSHEQAHRKVFVDRLPRVLAEKRDRGWHTQYNQYQAGDPLAGWERHGLIPWSEQFFATEFLVERISGVGLVDD